MRASTFLCIILTLGLVACGSGEVPVDREDMTPTFDPDAGTSDIGGSGANEAFSEILQGACEKAFDCCDENIARQIAGVSFRDECAGDSIQAFSATTVRSVSEAALAGTIEVDPSAAGLCRQALLASTCDEWTTVDPLFLDLPGCAEVIVPQLGPGEECTDDFECTTGLCLDTDSGRACVELVEDGMPCDPEAGIYCKPTSTCDNFEAFECVPLARAGDACVADIDCLSQECESMGDEESVCKARGSVCEMAER